MDLPDSLAAIGASLKMDLVYLVQVTGASVLAHGLAKVFAGGIHRPSQTGGAVPVLG